MKLSFEWNAAKANTNLSKHDVNFDEAETVFDDPFAITFPDEEHSQNEVRFIILGFSNKARILIVVFTKRDETIRLISSRKATKNERKSYEQYR